MLNKDSKLRVGLIVEDTDRFLRPIEQALQARYTVTRFVPSFIHLPLIGQRVNEFRLKQQLKSCLADNDVVFFEWAGPLAAMASHLPGRAVRIVRAHRVELFSHIDKFDWSHVDTVITVSHAMKAVLQRGSGIPDERIVVIHNGVDLSRFQPVERTFGWRLGMLGSLTPRKRVYDVICALADLPSEIPWTLSVGGGHSALDQDYYDGLQHLIATLDILDKVQFEGEITDTDAWFRNIDTFISASYSEGLQVALLEAMASGCHCLSHCWRGANEVLPADLIYTTSADLRAKLVDFASLTESEKAVKQQSLRERAEECFDEHRMVKEVLQIIEHLVVH